MKWEVHEKREGAKTIRHIYSTPDFGDQNFYRLTVSANAFKNRMSRRNWIYTEGKGCSPRPGLKFRFFVYYFEDRELDRKIWTRLFGEEKASALESEEFAEPIEHAGLKEFYQHIGFDYKENRFCRT